MTIELWLAFVAASSIVFLVPGPTILVVLSYALSQGRRVAVASALGVATGDLITMTTSLIGLGALVATSASLFGVLKWIGAGYLIYLGIQFLRKNPTKGLQAEMIPDQIAAKKVFGHAMTVTALNPKSIAFFIAFVPQFINTNTALTPQFAILIVTFVTLGGLNALAYALLADQMRARIAKASTLRTLNRVGGFALIGMGILTATLKRAP
ncbi:MAG: threonine/homoserine/homoserine lactone efflux protein [Paracoccaceae bacterium]|jgi:threonine/homoserine/homoserine lactone efflux protein